MRILDAIWRAAAVIAAVVLSLALVIRDPEETATIAYVALLLAAGGALANRRWAAALPLMAAGLCLLWTLVTEGTNLAEDGGETTWALVLVIMGAAAILATVGLLSGVLVRRLLEPRLRAASHPRTTRTGSR